MQNMLKDIITNRIGSMIFVTGILVRCLSSQTFTELGLEVTPEQYLILLLILENEGLYQRQISEITLKDRANVARIVNILLEKELITKTTDSNGRRIFKIVATEKGKDLCRSLIPVDKELRKIITENITEEELNVTFNTLQKIKGNVQTKVKLQI